MARLGLNIDHVATLREARRGVEPDPVWGAVEGQLAGAQCITVHLREDRRHIQDHDLERLLTVCQVKLNLEMAATDQMVAIATRCRPHMCTLVPEGRQEVTTEGGLDVAGQVPRLKDVVAALGEAGMLVSAFVDPEPSQIQASAEAGFSTCEVHTGPFAQAFEAAAGDPSNEGLQTHLNTVRDTGRRIIEAGMLFNAGHGLNFQNVRLIASLDGLQELHIGHSIISRAVFVGLRTAVQEMLSLIQSCEKRTGRL